MKRKKKKQSDDDQRPDDGRQVEISLKLNVWMLPVLVVLLLGLQVIRPYRGWLTLLIGLGGALVISYLWVRSLRNGLTLTRKMRFGWAQVGDRIQEQFELAHRGWTPVSMVELIDHSTLPGYDAGRGTSIGIQNTMRWHKDAVCTRRGVFSLGPSTLSTGDPFGIFSLKLHYSAAKPFVVLPPIVPLPGIQVAPGGRGGDGHPRPNVLHRTISAASVRAYVPGDSLRWIHWPTSARHESFYVRMFEGMPAGDWWIVLDMDQRVHVGQAQHSTEEHGVILAASLADKGLRSRRAVGLVAQGADLTWLQPRRGDTHRWEMMRMLANVSLGTYALAETLAEIGPVVEPYASLVIVTPSLDSAWVEELMLLLRRGISPTVLLLDPQSFGGNGSAEGLSGLLSDLEVQHYVITHDYLDRAETQPGRQGRLDWYVLGTGQIVPKYPEQDMTWRELV